jgi:hypothetical protein
LNDPWDWKEQDLLDLIRNQVKESIDLDYKASAALGLGDGKKNEISKDVSAFANSAGGTIVYGMVEDGHIPSKLDEGFDPSGPITKEWLEQVINSRIQRRIDGVRINQVELSQSRPGRVAYVVHIQQSMRAPHMASDNKYYKRFNFESVPMEDYEVRDTSRREAAPDLKMAIDLVDQSVSFSPDAPIAGGVTLRPRVLNESGTPAEYAIFQVVVDSRLKVVSSGDFTLWPESCFLHLPSGAQIRVELLSCNWRIPSHMPIWQGTPFGMATIVVQLSAVYTSYVIGWFAQSPRMTERQGWYELKATLNTLSLEPMDRPPLVGDIRSLAL